MALPCRTMPAVIPLPTALTKVPVILLVLCRMMRTETATTITAMPGLGLTVRRLFNAAPLLPFVSRANAVSAPWTNTATSARSAVAGRALTRPMERMQKMSVQVLL